MNLKTPEYIYVRIHKEKFLFHKEVKKYFKLEIAEFKSSPCGVCAMMNSLVFRCPITINRKDCNSIPRAYWKKIDPLFIMLNILKEKI